MNILDKHIILKLNKLLIEGFHAKDNPLEYKKYKQRLNLSYGIFFYNIMKTTNREIWTIMAKRKAYTYIYSYNSTTNELSLKGERKNACT